MTIASEITRLQWAKASIEASIENKGITVPDNAKIDTYSSYIDQIPTGWWILTNWLTTTKYTLSTGAWHQLSLWSTYSWDDSNAYYGICPYNADEYACGICVIKKTDNNDISYRKTEVITQYYRSMYWVSFWEKDTTIRCYFASWRSSRGNYVGILWVWDYDADTYSVTNLWTFASPWVENRWQDLTWWTEVTGNSWIKNPNASWDSVWNYGYFNLTLK